MNIIRKSNYLTLIEIVTVTVKGYIYIMGNRKDAVSQIKKEEQVNSYRENIVEMVGQIEDAGTLQYLHRFIELFLEKWG